MKQSLQESWAIPAFGIWVQKHNSKALLGGHCTAVWSDQYGSVLLLNCFIISLCLFCESMLVTIGLIEAEGFCGYHNTILKNLYI